MFLRQMLADQRQLSLRLDVRHAGPQARHNMKEPRSAILHSYFRILTKRGKHIGRSVQLESRGRNAYDDVGFSFQNQARSDYRGISSIAALPQAVTDDYDGRCAGPVFFGSERATLQEGHAEDGKQF
jgi:hypothetical protein